MMRSNTGISGAHRRRRFGFTLVETLVATSISVVVLGGVASVYYWTSQQMVYAQRVSWSHLEALKSSRTLQYYLRGAQEVTAIDTNRAQWVEVRMADGSLTRLVYENPIQGQRDGFLYVTNSTGRHTSIRRPCSGAWVRSLCVLPIVWSNPWCLSPGRPAMRASAP